MCCCFRMVLSVWHLRSTPGAAQHCQVTSAACHLPSVQGTIARKGLWLSFSLLMSCGHPGSRQCIGEPLLVHPLSPSLLSFGWLVALSHRDLGMGSSVHLLKSKCFTEGCHATSKCLWVWNHRGLGRGTFAFDGSWHCVLDNTKSRRKRHDLKSISFGNCSPLTTPRNSLPHTEITQFFSKQSTENSPLCFYSTNSVEILISEMASQTALFRRVERV